MALKKTNIFILKLEEKIEQRRELLSKFPNNAILWKELSQLLWEQGARESLQCVEKALIMNPNSASLKKQRQEILASGLFTLGSLQFRHNDEIIQVRVTEEGKILSASRDKTCKLWDISGRELQKFTGHEEAITSMDLSPDNNWFVTGSEDGTCRLWDIKGGREILILRGHQGAVLSVLFSPDGKYLLSGGDDSKCRIWDLEKGAESLCFDKHQNPVTALAISSDGTLGASADEKGLSVVWLMKSGKVGRGFQAGEVKVNSLCFSSNKRHLLSASEDGKVCLWDAALGQEIKVFDGHRKAAYYACFLEEDSKVLSTSEDGTIRIWDGETGSEVRSFKGPYKPVYSFSLHPNGKLAVSSGKEQCLRLWKFQQGTQLYQPQGPSNRILSMDCRRYLATATGDESCQVWNPHTGSEIRRLEWPDSSVCKVAISPNGALVAMGEKNGTIRLWNIAEESVYKSLLKHELPITCLGFSPKGDKMVSADYSGEVVLWDVESGDIRVDGNIGFGAIFAAQFFPFGEFMALGTEKKICLVVNMEKAEDCARFEKHRGAVKKLCINWEGKILSSAGDEELFIWDGPTGKEEQKLEGHKKAIQDIALLSQKGYCVSGDILGNLFVWDMTKGEKIQEVLLEEPISQICLNEEEQELLVAMVNGCIRRIPEYKLI